LLLVLWVLQGRAYIPAPSRLRALFFYPREEGIDVRFQMLLTQPLEMVRLPRTWIRDSAHQLPRRITAQLFQERLQFQQHQLILGPQQPALHLDQPFHAQYQHVHTGDLEYGRVRE
jgi:hypothetical protein